MIGLLLIEKNQISDLDSSKMIGLLLIEKIYLTTKQDDTLSLILSFMRGPKYCGGLSIFKRKIGI